MSERLRRALILILALVFIVSLGAFIWNVVDREKGISAYEEAESIAGLPVELPPPPAEQEAEYEEDPYFEYLASVDLDSLQEVNPDVSGWIFIPDTKISYPLLVGEDNNEYLYTTWQRQRSALGSIFFEARSNSDLSDFNTIIYGHRMKNGAMFGDLRNYNSMDFWSTHPYVYILNGQGVRKYHIFAALTAGVESSVFQVSFANDEEKQSFLDDSFSLNVLSTGLVPTVNDKILTLSTCTGYTYAARWIVQAYLVELSITT